MNAGRELDALVAEKVMGWDMVAKLDERASLPHYSTDIAAAWQVVERIDATRGHWDGQHVSWTILLERGPGPWNGDAEADAAEDGLPIPETGYGKPENVGRWTASFYNYCSYDARGESAAHAICLAALQAFAAPPRR